MNSIDNRVRRIAGRFPVMADPTEDKNSRASKIIVVFFAHALSSYRFLERYMPMANVPIPTRISMRKYSLSTFEKSVNATIVIVRNST